MSETLKVINLGLPKSGTTTLGHALKEAGFKVADFRIRRWQVKDPERQRSFVANLVYRGYYETGDPLALMPEFDAFSEISQLTKGKSIWPQMDWGVIAAIKKHHPNAKFLASTRDPEEHVSSMMRWTDLGTHRLPASSIPGLPEGYGASVAEQVKWVSAHHAFLRKVFENDDSFLEYDVKDPDAPNKIAAHIGREMPWWGKRNQNAPKVSTKDAAPKPAKAKSGKAKITLKGTAGAMPKLTRKADTKTKPTTTGSAAS